MSNREVTENSLANLKQFKPGESGNPNGRPIGSKNGLRARLMRNAGEKVIPNILKMLKQEGIKLKDNENAEALAEVLYSQALHGDIQSAKLIADLTEPPLPKDVILIGNLNITKIERVIID